METELFSTRRGNIQAFCAEIFQNCAYKDKNEMLKYLCVQNDFRESAIIGYY